MVPFASVIVHSVALSRNIPIRDVQFLVNAVQPGKDNVKGKWQPDLDLDVFLIRPFDPRTLQNGRPNVVLPAGDLFLAQHTSERTRKC